MIESSNVILNDNNRGKDRTPPPLGIHPEYINVYNLKITFFELFPSFSKIFSLLSLNSPEYASVQASQGEAIEEGRGEGQVGPILQVSTEKT